jgi:nucleosome assembly protein 1-like 1
LNFFFESNEFFTNANLKKTFFLRDGENPLKSDGTIIDWREGKNVTKKTVNKKMKNNKSGMLKTVQKEIDAESFFNFFKSINLEEKEVIEKMNTI